MSNEAQQGRVGRGRGTLLALAGLKAARPRHRARAVLDIDKFLPAPGQGAIAITARRDDVRTLDVLKAISDAETMVALTTERAFLPSSRLMPHADRGPRAPRGREA